MTSFKDDSSTVTSVRAAHRDGLSVQPRTPLVPYIAMWSEEEFLRPHRVLDFLGRVAYGDEMSSDRDSAGLLLWLLGDARGDWPGWPEDMAAVHPPVCLPCAWKSTRMCPHLKSGFVAVRVKHYPVVGAYGCFYDPRNPARKPLADASADTTSPTSAT